MLKLENSFASRRSFSASKNLVTVSYTHLDVYKRQELKQGSLAGARQKVSMIVGRDTEDLSEEQVAKAAIETVAENTSDGTVAPLLFMAVGGAPLGFLYKGINTLDSMVGYKNEVYLFFGRFSAKLDDAANFIPARVSAFLMIGASALLGMDFRNAWRIFRRDRFNHASPNLSLIHISPRPVWIIKNSSLAKNYRKIQKSAETVHVNEFCTFFNMNTILRRTP